MHSRFTTIIICISFAFLSACVTTIDKPERKVDEKKALAANVRLGMQYLQKGDRDNAIRSFTKALELDSRSGEANQGMALVHQLNGEHELAEDRFKKALRGRADFSRAGIEYSYGRFLADNGRCEDAFEYFESASKEVTYTGRANALVALGICANKLGDVARAKAAFEYALNLNKRIPAASLELAEISFAERDYAASKKYLDQFAATTRQTPRSLWLGIRLERIFGNKDKEASFAMALKNLYPYSKEYLDYKNLIEHQQ